MEKKVRRGVSGALAALVLLCVGSLSASTFVAMSLEELVAESESVVLGSVVEVRSFWDEGRKVILSEALISIDESLVGEAVGQVRVRTFGGRVDDYEVVAHGFPAFTKGKRVVLFLDRQQDETLRVTGYQLGHYRVIDRQGVEVAVPTLDSGATLVNPTGTAVQPEPRELAAFKAELATIANNLASAN